MWNRALSLIPGRANPPPANTRPRAPENNPPPADVIPILSRATVPLWTGDARMVYYIHPAPAAVNDNPPAVNGRKISSDCFDELLKLRESLDAEVEKVRKEARTRGYYMMAGQIASGMALFLPFAKKNFKNGLKKGAGLGIYLFFMVFIAVLIWISLWKIIKKFEKLEHQWEDLLMQTEEMLIGSRLVCKKTDWKDKVDTEASEEGKRQLRLQDTVMLNKMKKICATPDFGWMGSRLVIIEMVVATIAMITIPVTATYTRLS